MKYIILIATIFTQVVFAQDAKPKFKGESEASAIVVSGNTNNETYAAKTKNQYALTDLDIASIFGKYIKSTAGGTETGNAWEAGARYERVIIADQLNGFVQHKAESDPYNGIFVQRDSTDLGLKYIIIARDDLNWFTELGLRSSKIYDGTNVEYVNYGRLYTEASDKFSSTTTGKVWVEYLPNFKNSNEYLYNAEISLSVVMTSVLSLKTAYLLNHNEALASPLKKDSTTWTTALVANY